MATYRRFRVQRKYVNGQPTDETRLGEQIDSTDYPSLEECERGSGCTNIEYNWVEVDGFVCVGTRKYTKLMKQQRCVGTTEWVNVYPYEYKEGNLIGFSEECGYETKTEQGVEPYGECGLKFITYHYQKINEDEWELYDTEEEIKEGICIYTMDGIPNPSQYSNYSYSWMSLPYISYVSEGWGYLSHIVSIIDCGYSVSYVEEDAFKLGCCASAKLETISLPVCISIGNEAFIGGCGGGSTIKNIYLPLCETIGANVFNLCGASSIDLPECKYLGNNTLYGAKFSSISLPKVEEFGFHTFRENNNITEITLPNCIDIGKFQFDNCANLKSVYLPNPNIVCTLNSGMFTGMSETLIYVPEELVSIYISLYGNLPTQNLGGGIYDYLRDRIVSMGYIRPATQCEIFMYLGIKSSYTYRYSTSILSRGFHSAYAAISIIDLGGCITTVESEGMARCSNLHTLSLSGIETIGAYAFSYCSLLNSVTLGKNLNYIDYYAFKDCYNLSRLAFIGSSVVSFHPSAFYYCNYQFKIQVPQSLYNDYLATYEGMSVKLGNRPATYYSEIFESV